MWGFRLVLGFIRIESSLLIFYTVFHHFLHCFSRACRTFDTLRNHPSFYCFNHRGRVLFRSPEEEPLTAPQAAPSNPLRLRKLENFNWDWPLPGYRAHLSPSLSVFFFFFFLFSLTLCISERLGWWGMGEDKNRFPLSLTSLHMVYMLYKFASLQQWFPHVHLWTVPTPCFFSSWLVCKYC